MRKTCITLSFTLLFGASASFASAQGCSDAGFCSINSFKPQTPDTTLPLRSQVKAGVTYGSADNNIAAISGYLEFSRQFGARLQLDAKLTALSQSGSGISVAGLSDVYLNGSYVLSKALKATLGLKVPLMDANRKRNGLSLPMDYQSSLGTLDLIAGVGYTWRRLQMVVAIQQPLTQNSNGFLADMHPMGSDIMAFQSTNNFKRSADALLRLSYPVVLGKKLLLTPSLLPIYHLANDKFTDGVGAEREITGSQGLTLNGNVVADYALNQHSTLQLSAGAPFIVRKARPDGLTRHFVVNLEYRIRF